MAHDHMAFVETGDWLEGGGEEGGGGGGGGRWGGGGAVEVTWRYITTSTIHSHSRFNHMCIDWPRCIPV